MASNLVPAVLFLLACTQVVVNAYYTSYTTGWNPWNYATATRPPYYTSQQGYNLHPGGGAAGGTAGYGYGWAATAPPGWNRASTPPRPPSTTKAGVLWLISEFFSLTRRLDAQRTYNATRRSDSPLT